MQDAVITVEPPTRPRGSFTAALEPITPDFEDVTLGLLAAADARRGGA
jgi:hypothetical protein